MHSWPNGTRCRDDVNVLCCHSHFVCLVFKNSIPTCTCFCLGNFLDLFLFFFLLYGLPFVSILGFSIFHDLY